MRLRFLHTPKPKQFEYKPLYYDEKKEKLEQRLKEMNNDPQEYNPDRFRAKLSEKFQERRKMEKKKIFNSRSIIYIVILVGALYFVLFKYKNILSLIFGND